MMHQVSRRTLIAGLTSAGGLAVIGCAPSGKEQGQEKQGQARRSPRAAGPRLAAMTVYRDPSCGCCEAWAGIAREAGYEVSLVDRPDMPAIKARYGVPQELASCHTAAVGDYVIEGHVPMEDVARLLKNRPAGIRGLAVAGMPRGAPGMEMPDGSKDPLRVMAFGGDGKISPFSA